MVVLGLLGCDDGASDGATDAGGGADVGASSSLALAVEGAPESAAAGSEVALRVRLTTGSGEPAGGLALEAEIKLGGGSAAGATTAADGTAEIRWQLGAAPVAQRLRVGIGPAAQEIQLVATAAAEPPTATPLGDVPGWLAAEGIAGSTEDLEFLGGDLILGIPGGLVRLDPEGQIERVDLTGEALGKPLGIAADRNGNLWIADAGANALVKVDAAGAVTTALTQVGETPLEGPNYVAVGPDDKVYLSDPCLGLLIRFDPATGTADATHLFDRATEGGPNGFAFEGDTLWVVTENTVLTCGQAGIAAIDAPLAGLFRIPITAAGFGERAAVATGVGVFGDGVAIDAEHNVYVILDQVANLMLAESAVWVLPAGGNALQKCLVADGVLYANLAFGQGHFPADTLYVSLLSVPPFAGATSRGVHSFPLGIPGLDLLP